MTHPNFEAVKIAMKQDKEGFVLTLRLHPDDAPEAILRDFCGARYQVVMVRLDHDDKPMNREQHTDWVKMAGIISNDPLFPRWLEDIGELLAPDKEEAVEWLRSHLSVKSRADIPHNPEAVMKLRTILKEFNEWKS